MNIFSVISVFGGLAFFLFGMSMLSTGLEKLSGGRLEQILEKLTSNTFNGILLGALVTIAVQSSSATTVIVVGLVNAKILRLRQAIPVIMGANIGTTVTAHILRLMQIDSGNLFINMLNPKNFTPAVALIGILLYMAAKKPSRKDLGQMMLGMSILFTGMFQMESAVRPLRDLPQFAELFATLTNPILGVLVGAVVTAVIQSSAASVGILQALSSTGAISFSAAFPIIMGQNIGTCITPILASIGASKNAKRSAAVHLTFNILGTLIFLAATYAFQMTVGFPFWDDPIDMGGIANFHTIFNIVVTVLFIPFVGLLEKLVCTIIPSDDKEKQLDDILGLLDERLMRSPGLAVDHCRKVAYQMGVKAKENFGLAIKLINEDQLDTKLLERINENETTIDRMEVRLEGYLLELAKHPLSDLESQLVNDTLHIIEDFERMGDQAVNISDNAVNLRGNSTCFSADALQELRIIVSAVDELIDMALDAYSTQNIDTARRIEPLEEVVDGMEESLKNKHVRRLQDGQCSANAAFPFVETLANLEKIGDYCSNLGMLLISHYESRQNPDFNPHTYIRELHKGNIPGYSQLYEYYDEKYYSKIRQAAVQA